MPAAKAKPTHQTAADTSAAVDAFMATLDHPFKDVIQALRTTIVSSDPRIAEGVKWNAPSYRTSEYFATTHLRQKGGVGLVLHRGAKVRADEGAMAIEDPQQLLQWLASDRAIVVFTGMADFKARRDALLALLTLWIAQV